MSLVPFMEEKLTRKFTRKKDHGESWAKADVLPLTEGTMEN